MLKRVLILLIVSISIFSCEKEDTEPIQTLEPDPIHNPSFITITDTVIVIDPSLRNDTITTRDTSIINDTILITDSIFYPPQPFVHTVFNPPIEWSTIDSFAGCVPQPTEVSIKDSLNLDLDPTIDIAIFIRHWPEFVSSSSPCVNYYPRNFNLSVLSNDFEFLKIPYNIYGKRITLDNNVRIDNKTIWGESGYAYFFQHNTPFSISFSGIKYIGFRKSVGSDYYYGWIKIEYVGDFKFRLHEIIYNPNPNMSLKTGQTTF